MNASNPQNTFNKVLVIDDNEMDLYLAMEYIEDSSFAKETILLNSATKALEYLKSLENNSDQLPQLIFLDIRMPKMDGFGFLEEFQNFSDNIKSKCTIIMLSSSMDLTDYKRVSDNPLVSQFLNKPLDEETLINLKKEYM